MTSYYSFHFLGEIKESFTFNNKLCAKRPHCLFVSFPPVASASPVFWLTHLSSMSKTYQQGKTTLSIYGGLVSIAFLLPLICAVLFFLASLRSSERLHDKMVSSLLQAPVLFFDTNPAGRILNRFSKDIGSLDDVLPRTFFLAIQCLLSLCSSVLIPSIVNFWNIFVSLPIVFIFAYLANYYLKTSRDLKRLESTYRSPIFSHFSETICGLDTIRTRGRQLDLTDKFYK